MLSERAVPAGCAGLQLERFPCGWRTLTRRASEGGPRWRVGLVCATHRGTALFGTEYGEVKRMYVRPEFRGSGYGKLLLEHLADYARAQGIALLRLETGIHQPAAIRLYEGTGFQRIAPFGDYVEDPLCLYYEKRIS